MRILLTQFTLLPLMVVSNFGIYQLPLFMNNLSLKTHQRKLHVGSFPYYLISLYFTSFYCAFRQLYQMTRHTLLQGGKMVPWSVGTFVPGKFYLNIAFQTFQGQFTRSNFHLMASICYCNPLIS